MSVKCPRCGAEGALYRQRIGNREYVYVRHRKGKSEKKCYLGPANEYVFVQRVYSDAFLPLGLKNIADVDLTQVLQRLIEALRLQYHRFMLLKQINNLHELHVSLKRVLSELQLLISDIERDLMHEEEQKIAQKLGLESGP
ncbi:MAG: hypothetical protein QXG48_06065 [Thermofilaceae archaeon]